VSLDDFLPVNNIHRHLEARLELSFVREWAPEHYAEPGCLSIDPAVLFNLQLARLFERVHVQELEGEHLWVLTSRV
jgi:hypothetical protein